MDFTWENTNTLNKSIADILTWHEHIVSITQTTDLQRILVLKIPAWSLTLAFGPVPQLLVDKLSTQFSI